MNSKPVDQNQAEDDGLEALAVTYDEHEVRVATYHGRDLKHSERVQLGIEGLTRAIASRGWSISDFEKASDVMETALRNGETVGRAIVAGLRMIDKG